MNMQWANYRYTKYVYLFEVLEVPGLACPLMLSLEIFFFPQKGIEVIY